MLLPNGCIFPYIYLGKPNILPSTKEHINDIDYLRCPQMIMYCSNFYILEISFLIKNHYTKMCFSSFWVSLNFE